YFVHHRDGPDMTWRDAGRPPVLGRLFSDDLASLLGPAREAGATLERRHQDVAATLQARLEEVYLGLLNALHARTGLRALCLAGGVAFNCVANGKIVGWFQGRMEWGPRALGNRSIVADPRRPEMKDVLNRRIKHREPFRPFAPSVLEEATDDYFERASPSPFMNSAYPVRPEKRAAIPAPTHVDGTGRLQTVSQKTNPRYWRLIKEFERLTGVPVVLNTSFNENEPIVCTPEEAVDCFLRTQMDVLAIGDFLVEKGPS